MTFESFSGILVCLVLLAFVLWWFPTRASRSMKDATKHGSDRFSESMRIIDVDERRDASEDVPRSGGIAKGVLDRGEGADDSKTIAGSQSREGARGTDAAVSVGESRNVGGSDGAGESHAESGPKDSHGSRNARGARPAVDRGDDEDMESPDRNSRDAGPRGREDPGEFSPGTVNAIRSARRRAFRRRRIVVALLLAATAATFVFAFVVRYSPVWALVPVALLATVLALGVRASAQARAWERRLAQHRAHERNARHGAARGSHGARAERKSTQPVSAHPEDSDMERGQADSTPTVKLDGRQIAQAISRDESPAALSFTLGATDGTSTSTVRSAEIKSYRQVAKAVPRRGMTGQIRRAAQRESAEVAAKAGEAQKASGLALDRELQRALERRQKTAVAASSGVLGDERDGGHFTEREN